MHQALHFYLKFLAEEVVEGGEHLQVPHIARLDAWDLNVETQRGHLLVLMIVVGHSLHGNERDAAWPRVLEPVDLQNGRVDTGLTLCIHESNRKLSIESGVRMLKVSLLFHPQAYNRDQSEIIADEHYKQL